MVKLIKSGNLMAAREITLGRIFYPHYAQGTEAQTPKKKSKVKSF